MKLLISVFLTVVLLNKFYCRRLEQLEPSPFYQDPSGTYSESHGYHVKGHNDTHTLDKDGRLGLHCCGLTWENNERETHDSKNYNEGDQVSFYRPAQVPPPAPQAPTGAPGYYPPYGAPGYYPPYGAPNGSPYGPQPGNPPYGAPNGSPYGPPVPPGNPSYGAPNPPCGAPTRSPNGSPPCG